MTARLRRMLREAATAAFVLVAAGAVQAQTDSIGALLDQEAAPAPAAQPPPPAEPQYEDEEAAEAAPQSAAQPGGAAPALAAAPPPAPTTPLEYARPPTPTPSMASAASYPPFPARPPGQAIASLPRPRPGTAGTPVHIDELGKTPEGPPSAVEVGYEQRLRASFSSAQGLQGPLDGSWVLSADGGGDLYSLELVDRSSGALEGAWRDLRRAGALNASGFVDDIQRYGGQLTLRFFPHGREPAVATLAAGLDGRWAGEFTDGGERRTVTLRRK
ncbi:hypothetical protein [Phenylobacterium sp.]|jgi:hypothetical protein|uniref:hypothetical protein n=1 Tax=Phenylobacterium sp. TaxID=1871053 RepID=UPI002F416E56